MKFRFNLEALRKHRGRLEDEAKRRHAEAKDILDQCLKRIQAMYDSIDETRKEIAKLQHRPGADRLETIRQMESYIQLTQVKIQRERLKAREYMQNVEIALEALIEAGKGRKILDKLKERRKSEYQADVRRHVERELDDLTTMRFKRRGII